MTKLSDLPSLVGQEVGLSRWITVDQARIDAFARITEDEQFIHVDPERAKSTPFGGTIAHGFLTLSLASTMSYDAVAPLDGDLSGLPPTLIQVGSHETLRVDSEDFAAALAAAGVPVRLEIYKGAVHVFQAFIDVLPESRTAIKAMARFAVQCYGDAGWTAD